jgi:NADH dehydrogenase (ubiquinone) Fe-S protein 1
MDLGFQPNHRSTPLAQSKLVYLLGADQISASDLPSGAFVVYQGHHGDAGAHYADVILPGSAYTEKSGTFVNTEGRTQLTRTAVAAPGSAREDWKIIRALSEVVGHTLPYDDLYAVRQRMASIAPHLTHYGAVEPTAFTRLGLDYAVAAAAPASGSKKSASLSWSKQPLPLAIKDFYMTDPISRSSVTMAKCSAAFTCGIINETEAISSN